MAVDPTTGNLLIADPGAEGVRRYDSSGTLLETVATPSIGPAFIAAAPDGSVYAASGEGPDIARFSGAGTLLGTISGVGSLRGLGYDASHSLIIAAVGEKLKSYSTAGALLSESPVQGGGGLGLAASPLGYLYEYTGGSINYYVPATVPGVEAPQVSAVAPDSAHVSAEVDPGVEPGGSPGDPPPAGTKVHFEYRLKGDPTWQLTPDQNLTSPGLAAVQADIAGLKANFDYEVRAIAANDFIPEVASSTVGFHTAPTAPEVETSSATDVAETSAVLNGNIDSVGLQTTYHFEYGSSTAYGSRIPLGIEAVAGNEHGSRSFSNKIAGLQPGTTYHFRIVAKNSIGETLGGDQSFTTPAASSIPTRAYEQVTPANKEGVAVAPRLGYQASDDGNAVSYTVKAGDQSTPLFTRSIAFRESSDWQGGIDTDPPINVGPGVVLHTTLALSDDLSHSLVVSNRVLNAEGGYEYGANLYRGDVRSGDFELVGTSNATEAFLTFTSFTSTGKFLAGAPDFSWVIFVSPKPLMDGAPLEAMYRWSVADGLEVMSVLPNGDASSSIHAINSPNYNVASNDGSRVYYSAVKGAEKGVFLRNDGGLPKPISVSEGDLTTPRPAVLLGVTEDGRYAFFESSEAGSPLTDDAPGGRGDVYRYDSTDESLAYLGIQAYVSLAGGTVMNQGSFRVAPDGATFWFVNEGNPSGGGSEGSPDDFRVWHEGAVHTVPIPTDSPYPPGPDMYPGEERISSNGRYFVFSKTVSGVGAAYLYDAYTDNTVCVSCLPDGTPVSATLSASGRGDVLVSNSAPLGVTDTGTVYLDTTARLVAVDVNGTRDVYAYQAGHHTLISPGNRPFDAALATVTPDGDDVFFTTAQKLVGRDNDESIDVYDARVNGGLPAQSPPPAQVCLRDDCKATPGAGAELPFGGSEALAGPGNVQEGSRKRCGKGTKARKVKGKRRCVKDSKKKAPRPDTNRRHGR